MKISEKNKKRMKIGGIILALLLLFFIAIPALTPIDIDFTGSGHGQYSKGGWTSLLQSLGIEEGYDYVDEETGEGYCINDACWDEADAEYDRCIAEEDAGGELEIEETFVAIADPDGFEDTACEDAYDLTLTTVCSERCEKEVYMWDKTPVTDLGNFAQTAFPRTYENWAGWCEFFFIGGTWVSIPEKVGCVDAMWIWCDTNSLMSAGEVCTAIGKTWTCTESDAYCAESE